MVLMYAHQNPVLAMAAEQPCFGGMFLIVFAVSFDRDARVVGCACVMWPALHLAEDVVAA